KEEQTVTNSYSESEAIASNAHRLLWAGFMAILAAGIGFAIRGGILDNWGGEYGFTQSTLGIISGAGFTGFCFGIIIGGVIVDKIGYGKLVVAAFLLHILSAIVTLAVPSGAGANTAYNYLFWGTFLFAVANGTLEAVANPLVATLFPNKRTHYLNILHASWPAGLVLGGILGWVLDDQMKWHWKYQLALFLIPTVLYGLMFLGQRYPKSEAAAKGLSLGQMLKDVGMLGGLVACAMVAMFFNSTFGFLKDAPWNISPTMIQAISIAIGAALLMGVGLVTNFATGSILLFVLFLTHALVGAVELGTDNWIQNITGNILTSSEGKILFVFTSLTMFLLRFCADFIEKKIGLTPLALLLVCAVLACIGLNLTSGISSFGGALLALTIYGIGKTFFWPTMLAVLSDRFPRTGAVAMSIMGGIGMMSAGLLGSPGLGYAKDRYATEALTQQSPELAANYRAEKPSSFLFLKEVFGLDQKKMKEIKDIKVESRNAEQKTVITADQEGDRRTLRADSLIPATMAVIYLLLMLYFKSIGGYRPLKIEETETT
ncbi:MAG: MFS transporter, partial [Pirellulaceae bacterium]